jgi:hypothetical protein
MRCRCIEDLRKARINTGLSSCLTEVTLKLSEPKGTFLITDDLGNQLALNRIDGDEQQGRSQVFLPAKNIKIQGIINNPQPLKYPGLKAAEAWLQQPS